MGSTPDTTPCTVELLQAFTVILGQAVLGGLPDRTLVEGPHDGVRRRGVAQAQCVAKLMNCHGKQVCPLTIWGGRETGLELEQPGKGQRGSPWGRGLLAARKSQDPQRWSQRPLPKSLPEPSHPSCMSLLIQQIFLLGSARHRDTGLK